jgi:hypothetical protein
MAGLAFGDCQTLALPVNVVEGERGDFPAAQAVGDQQQQDDVVALARFGPSVDPGQDSVDIGPGDGTRDVREPVYLGPPDGSAQVAAQHALAVRVAQEHSQDASTVAHRGLGQPRAGTFDDEGPEDRRREVLDRLDADPPQVGLEGLEVMAVAEHRGRTKAAFLDQVVEEARHVIGERLGVVGSAARLESRKNDREHLLDRTSNLLRHRPRRPRTQVVAYDPLGHERLDVGRQLADSTGPSCPSKLAELEHDWHPTPDGLEAVTILDQPNHVILDLRGHPRTPDPIDRRRLDEILLQHGSFLSPERD